MGSASDDNLLSSKVMPAHCEGSPVSSLVQTSDTETGKGIEAKPRKAGEKVNNCQ